MSSIEAQNDSARPMPSCKNQLHDDNSLGQDISVTGKATGKAKNWLNVSDAWSLDWSGVEEWKVVDESDVDGEESREELPDYEGPRVWQYLRK